jgi:hypothetical protein
MMLSKNAEVTAMPDFASHMNGSFDRIEVVLKPFTIRETERRMDLFSQQISLTRECTH